MPQALAAAVLLLALAACSDPQPPAPPPTPPKPVVKTEPAAAQDLPTAKAADGLKSDPLKSDPNSELASRVRRALEDEAKVQAAAIDVTASEGKVTLWGTASTDGERARAARVAKSVTGVKAIENKIVVVRGS